MFDDKDFEAMVLAEAARISSKYPQYWKHANRELEFYQSAAKAFSHELAFDLVAIMLYHRSIVGKDAKRIFENITRHMLQASGFGINQSHYMAFWYFLVVVLDEYNTCVGITELTRIDQMLECYINTGEVDYHHDWTM